MMKSKKEYIVIALAIILLSVYLFVRKTDQTEYLLPAITQVAASDITRIEIARHNGSVILEKKDGKWRIQPKDYAADSGKVNTMLDDLSKLTLTALVSESKSYARYDLDPDKAVHVKAWAGERLARDIQIGKPASTYQHTFVRIGDNPDVYHARENLKNAFDQTAENLRDKTVLAFSQDEVKEISITQDGKQTVIKKSEAPPAAAPPEAPPAPAAGAAPAEAPAPSPATKPAEVQWVTDQGKITDLSKMSRLLSTLSHLSCDSYLDDKNPADLGMPVRTLVVQGKKNYTLSLYAKTDKDAKTYIATSSEVPSVFTLSNYQAEPLMADPDSLTTPAEKPDQKK